MTVIGGGEGWCQVKVSQALILGKSMDAST
jgi:hypothetical protein